LFNATATKDIEGAQFLQWCLSRLQLYWPGYGKARRQVYKRIQKRLHSLGLASLTDYPTYLESHSDEWQRLECCCWILISRFYRDESVFLFLEQEFVPHFARQIYVQGGGAVGCWSLGCAAGEEPDSLSLLWKLRLQDQHPTVRLVILATDVDEQALAHAQRGCYRLSRLRDLPQTWRTEGFDQTSEGDRIKLTFRESVTCVEQDIRQAEPQETFHLILCRYLAFTCFNAPLQSKTLQRTVARMQTGSALVVGNRETLPSGEFGPVPWSEKNGVYRRA